MDNWFSGLCGYLPECKQPPRGRLSTRHPGAPALKHTASRRPGAAPNCIFMQFLVYLCNLLSCIFMQFAARARRLSVVIRPDGAAVVGSYPSRRSSGTASRRPEPGYLKTGPLFICYIPFIYDI